MEIEKILLGQSSEKENYVYPENSMPGSEAFSICFNGEYLNGEKKCLGGKGISGYHILTEGSLMCTYNDGRKIKVEAGDVFNCETEDLVELEGKAGIFNMIMGNGVRGFIRTFKLNGKKMMRVGEGVGESHIAFIGLNGTFTLEYEGKKFCCEKDSAIIIHAEKKEFGSVVLTADGEDISVAAASGVQLLKHDFGKFIGVRFLERSEGYCKARLDIQPDHMNPIGTVHGGCLFTLADAVCGMAASSIGGGSTTVDSHIQFLNASFRPKYLIAESFPKKIGRKIRSFCVEIKDDQDKLIATVDFIFYSLQD